MVCGFVPVAAGSATSYSASRYPDNVPTMAVVGERDGQRSTDHIVNAVDNAQKQVIPRGGHPAYLDDPRLWHKLLYNLLTVVDC